SLEVGAADGSLLSCSRISREASALSDPRDGRSRGLPPALASSGLQLGVVPAATCPDAGWRFGAALLERLSSALFNTLVPMEMHEQLE
ncbi:MAG: hypothetical protein ACI8RN_002773, partial [Glaciecola sp.]